ncbi:MAG: Do family serine endopeptidase [Planctomycetia bacterium]|nr:Do family serine endopeptidase [Planctomycetia bacterium]
MSIKSLRGNSRIVVLLALLSALGLGTAWQRSGAVGEEPRKEVNPTARHHAEQLSEAFNNAAEIAMPSVVTIYSKTKAHPVAKDRGGSNPFKGGDNPFKGTPFEDFFNGFNGRGFEDQIPRQMPRRGMGSGVIIDKSGIVLTNYHVVDGADEVTVHLADGREFKGEDIKTDEQSDLAVVRISGAGTLPAAPLGDSDKLKIGDWVIAIGNPFELEQTVSAGIISGMGRELGDSGKLKRTRFLQTDAAINPGNSGGPLVNLNGEVIGINTAIATSNGSFQGIGFAIPSNQVKWVMGQLIKKGSVDRAYLGVGIGEISPDLAKKFGAQRGEGVLVSEVYPNTPAAQAGFEAGDVISKFAGQKVKNPRDLQEMVERVPLDSTQQVEVLRDGKTKTLQVVAKALPKEFGAVGRSIRTDQGPSKHSDAFDAQDLGIEVSEMTPGQAEELAFKGYSGVLITHVDPDKVAADQGLREGMLIMKVGRTTVKNVDEFKAALKGESIKDGIVLHVRTRNGNRFVLLKE